MEIRLIVREGAPSNIGSVLLEYKDIFKQNCRFKIERKTSKEEIIIRNHLKIKGLPILICKGQIVQGERDIINFLINILKSLQNDDREDCDWLETEAKNYINLKKQNKLADYDDDEDDINDKDMQKKIVQLVKNKNNITKNQPVKKSNIPINDKFSDALSQKCDLNSAFSSNITDDEIEMEKWLDDIRSGK